MSIILAAIEFGVKSDDERISEGIVASVGSGGGSEVYEIVRITLLSRLPGPGDLSIIGVISDGVPKRRMTGRIFEDAAI